MRDHDRLEDRRKLLKSFDTVDREIEGGASEVVELKSPCLVAVQTGLNQVRYASLKGIMAAKKKPLGEKPPAAAECGSDLVALAPPPDRPPGRTV